MNNYKLIKILLNLIALSFIGVTNSAHAYLNCTNFNYQGFQQCEAGIDSGVVGIAAASVGGQHLSQWCWAASIETVFRYYGFNVPQKTIVQQTWGQIVNLPAQPNVILANLNRSWQDSNGRYFSVSGETYSANPITAAQDLSQNMPLIIGTLGHAMVLTSLQYTRDQWGNGWVTSAVVRDPWPGRGRRILSAQEWYSTSFLARIRIEENYAPQPPNEPSHILADSVFTSIERQYFTWFPSNAYKTEEFEFERDIVYWRLYTNGSGLAEWKGDLWYKIQDGDWVRWGSLADW